MGEVDVTCPICLNDMSPNENLLSICGTHYMHVDCVGYLTDINTSNFMIVEINPSVRTHCPVCRERGNRFSQTINFVNV
ncbi:MAG: hypothetical protein K0U78_02760 [Actinomycetia bacterium]|nr:hypothetical protein [Actinomycetes bacterium]